MNNIQSELINDVIELEKSTLRSEVRLSKNNFDELLSEKFIEFGSSGNIYTKKDILESDLSESNYAIKDIKGIALGIDVIHIIYRLYNKNSYEITLRSSIWQWENNSWKMIFHQGTKCNN